VFAVRGGVATTPAPEVGLLRGITRERIIELARGAGIEVREGTVLPDDVRSADEVFITSSIRGVLPISHVDGARVGDACPGPVTRALMECYAGYLARVARGEV
jgi:branched-chain amino acid aminotransferase